MSESNTSQTDWINYSKSTEHVTDGKDAFWHMLETPKDYSPNSEL